MAAKGWVKIHREVLDKSIWINTTSDQKAILVTLLLLASHTPRRTVWGNEVIQLKSGQLITSLPSLARDSKTTIQAVRTALKKFEKFEFLTDVSTKKGRLITLINWDFYQCQDTKNEGDLTDSQQTLNRHSTDIQQTSNRNQELKNEELKNEELSSESQLLLSSSSSSSRKKKNDDDDDQKTISKIKKDYPKFHIEDIETAVALARTYDANNIEKYAIQIMRNETESEKLKAAQKEKKPKVRKTRFSNFKERDDIDFEELRKLESERIAKELAEWEEKESAAESSHQSKD